ncbi:hypothetical protein KEM63_10430 [Halopseudomonas nanhaiensis]|uniref:hypothetical protein n=1 Tax=Halopseudomonas nanhaiensis TaxID=2830842 RepID=UPI001CBE4F6E|nr:hypothetical protein [Halopseudomonas nanhaiensis]UAW97244.1 hypothetical protein KEM63_10430 [Halopseudomonas nanhaiensis]
MNDVTTAQDSSPGSTTNELRLEWSAAGACAQTWRPDAQAPYRVTWRISGQSVPAAAINRWHGAWAARRLPGVTGGRLADMHAALYVVTAINAVPTVATARSRPSAGWFWMSRGGYGRQRVSAAEAHHLMGRLTRRSRRLIGRAGAVLILSGAGLSV